MNTLSSVSTSLSLLTRQDALGNAEGHVPRTNKTNLQLRVHLRVHFDLKEPRE